MEDSAVIAAIITGSMAICLFLVKYIIQCICPGTCTGKLCVPACFGKPNDINPLVILPNCWEDRWLYDSEKNTKVNDSNLPRGYCKWFYTKPNYEEKSYRIVLTEKDIKEDAGVYLFRTLNQQNIQHHYFWCKIKYIAPEETPEILPIVNIRIKRFRTEINPDGSINEYKHPKILSHFDDLLIPFKKNCLSEYIGYGEARIPTNIGLQILPDNTVDVHREQLGLCFKNVGTYIIEAAYYSDDDMNVFSLSNCFYSFYKITEPRLIEEGANNE